MVVALLKNLAKNCFGDLEQDESVSARQGAILRMRLTFMMGMGSSPGVPRSSIMFLMSMERSAMIRSTIWISKASRDGERARAHTSLDVHAIRADQDDLLVIGGSHVVMYVDGITGCVWCVEEDKRWSCVSGS